MNFKNIALTFCALLPLSLFADNFGSINVSGGSNLHGVTATSINSTGVIYSGTYLQSGGLVYGTQFNGSSVLTSSYIQTTGAGYVGTTMAIGYPASTATGSFSTAIGAAATASSYSSVVVGRNNVSGGNATSWVDADPLFVVGNGTGTAGDPNQYRNAFTVLKDGSVSMSKAQGDVLMGQYGN